MYYEINVSELRGGSYVHLFATAKRSLGNEWEAKRVYDLLLERFPEPQYNLQVTQWISTGKTVAF